MLRSLEALGEAGAPDQAAGVFDALLGMYITPPTILRLKTVSLRDLPPGRGDATGHAPTARDKSSTRRRCAGPPDLPQSRHDLGTRRFSRYQTAQSSPLSRRRSARPSRSPMRVGRAHSKTPGSPDPPAQVHRGAGTNGARQPGGAPKSRSPSAPRPSGGH